MVARQHGYAAHQQQDLTGATLAGIIIARADSEPGRLDACIREQVDAGFTVALDRIADGWRLIGFAPLLPHMPACVTEDDSGHFALASGSFFYRGKTGQAALKEAISSWRDGSLELEQSTGQYALLIGHPQHFELRTDALPSQRIYTDEHHTLFSTLLIPAMQLLPTLSPHAQGIYEYVWLHANHGQDTPVAELKALAPGERVRFQAGAATRMRDTLPDWLTPNMAGEREGDIVTHYAEQVMASITPAVDAFGDSIKTALSGGYDSRLLAAGLRSAGSDARYYVYGAPSSPDRRVAEALAATAGLKLQSIQKPGDMQLPADDYPAHIDRKALVFDGLYVEGLFDNGVDLDDRYDRLRDANVLLLGSGGECLRNFFYLPDRRYTPAQLIDTFWSTYQPSACTEAFDAGAFRAHLASQLASDIGAEPNQPMSRARAELAYPLFRVRYWTTREITVNQRYGWCLYPYLEQRLIRGTATVPLPWKNHGRLEGKLIARLAPDLASVASDYGFRFDEPIPISYRLKMLGTYLRPPALRAMSYRLKAVARAPAQWPGPELRAHWFDPDMPRMSAFFDTSNIRDPAAFNRVVTLEYLFARHEQFNRSLAANA